jgi:hypothetical protein
MDTSAWRTSLVSSKLAPMDTAESATVSTSGRWYSIRVNLICSKCPHSLRESRIVCHNQTEEVLTEIEVSPNPEPVSGTQLQAEFQYDALISYCREDSAWIDDALLSWLEGKGVRVCVESRDFEPGRPRLVNMENAVERSYKTLIVLTPAWIENGWNEFESLLIQSDDPAGRQARMIPLLLKPCELPKRIAMLTPTDLMQSAEVDSQLQRLIEAIRG